MFALRKSLVFFLIFTVISSIVAYRLVIASYEHYDYSSTVLIAGE